MRAAATSTEPTWKGFRAQTMVNRLHQAELRNGMQGPAEICPPVIKPRSERPCFRQCSLTEKTLHSSVPCRFATNGFRVSMRVDADHSLSVVSATGAAAVDTRIIIVDGDDGRRFEMVRYIESFGINATSVSGWLELHQWLVRPGSYLVILDLELSTGMWRRRLSCKAAEPA